jgi:Do/DeqQ family serine protease
MSNDYASIRVAALILVFICTCANAFAEAFERQTPVVRAVKNVGPAVVNISSEYEILKRQNPFHSDPFFENFFRDFFERRPEKRTSLGSGVIIDGKRGFILTNAHVVEKTATIKVLLQDEREFEARIVGADPDSDLAVLQISSKKPLPSVQMGNSNDLLIGETVIAIGNPFGFSHTVTTGVISAVNRSIKADERIYHQFIQTDASINPGNSGGPLLNINGMLIGINTAIYAKAQGIGFAIPINRAKRIVNDLIQHGHVIQGWIGLSAQDLDDRLARYLKLTDHKGALITQVETGSPAAAAGIEESDLIMAVQGRRVHTSADYYSLVRGIGAGEKLRLRIYRKDEARSFTFETRPYPKERGPKLAWRRMGVKVTALDSAARQRFGVSAQQGVVISAVRKESYMDRIGVLPGDVIRQIEDVSVSDTETFITAMIKHRYKLSVIVLLQRQEALYHLTVRMSP